MFSLYKTIHPPTGVDNSVFCNFISPKEQNLVISSANKLQIFKFYKSSEPANTKTFNAEDNLKLELVESFYLYGTISALKACKYGSMNKDALIIAFSDAKLSIVEYDNQIGDLVTLSIHYFEDELESEGVHYNMYEPILKVDPNMRCASMLIYGFKLVVIPFNSSQENTTSNTGITENLKTNTNPFHTDQDLDPLLKEDQAQYVNSVSKESKNDSSISFNKTHLQTKATSNSKTSLSSYTIDLRKLDNWLEMRIIDIEFLYGYYEPTLFILCESNMTWVGRYAVKKDTCNSVAISLNINQKTHPVIWPVDKLPSDCLKCYAVPFPIGGILIFAVNSLIYINQSVPSYAVSLNSLATTTSHYPFRTDLEHTKISLDSSQAIFISQDRFCVSLKGGELFIITLITDTESLRSVRCFDIEKCANSVISTCLSKCFDDYLFVGSRLGNSVLLKYSLTSGPSNINDEGDNETDLNFSSFPKHITPHSHKTDDNHIDSCINSINNDENLLMESENLNEQNEMDDGTKNKPLIPSNTYSFEVCDLLLNIAPCGHSIIGESVGDYTEFVNNNNDMASIQMNHIDLVTSSGYTKNGAISVLQRGLRPDLIATFQIQDIIDTWAVNLNDLESGEDLLEKNSITYLFLTKTDSTIILQISSEITELDRESSGFVTKEATLFCSNLRNKKYIIQITTSFIHVYCSKNNTASQEITLVYSFDLLDFQIDSKIKQAFILDPYICILTEKGSIMLFYFDYNNKTIKFIENKETQLTENVNCFSLFEDSNNLFATQLSVANVSSMNHNQTNLKENFKQNEYSNEEQKIVFNTQSFKSTTKFSFDSSNIEMEYNDIDDEDELLYGSSISQSENNSAKDNNFNDNITRLLTDQNPVSSQSPTLNSNNKTAFPNKIASSSSNLNENHSPESASSCLKLKKTFWLFTVKFDGSLFIYNVDSEKQGKKLELILIYPKFNLAPKTILTQSSSVRAQFLSTDNLNNTSSAVNNCSFQAQPSTLNSNSAPFVSEILVISCGNEKAKCLLIARIDEDLIIYEAIIHSSMSDQTNTLYDQLNFKRINHEIVVRDKRNKIKKTNMSTNKTSSTTGPSLNLDQIAKLDRDKLKKRIKQVPFLRQFDNLAGGLNGFAYIGSSLASYLVFYCARSGLTPHPLWLDSNQPILSFTSFSNSSITPSGFIYVNKNFDVRMCTLPIDDCHGKLKINYDANWILKKIQIRQTVSFICFHEESKTYAVCYTQTDPTNKLMQLGDEDKEIAEFIKDENFIYPTKRQFFIQLYTPLEWEPLPLGKYQLLEWEHVSSLKIVLLPYEGHSSGMRSYLAASTINCYSEDVNSRGRILIFDIIETVPEPDKPLTNTKIKLILEKEQKGPVTCLESVNGHLIGCVGQKIFIWEYKNNELIGKAFIDTHFYVHKMITLKNFVLVADLHKSISLIRFQEEYTKLSFVAKDNNFIDTYACEYLVDNSNLGFIASDSEKNLSVYLYQSESHDNQGGHWLIRKAEFNVGSHINSMFRLKCKVNDTHLDKRATMAEKKQVTYCTNLDGGIGYLIPLNEKTFRRLFILQNAIIAMIPHYAGLNPKSYRIWKGKRRELANPQKNILDGDLLFEYFNLSYNDRNDIAKKIKTNTEQLLDDLTEIFQLTCHF